MIYLPTSDPAGLLKSIKAAIDADSVRTWSYDSEGDFTHATEQWKQKAWLRPSLKDGSLDLHIIRPRGVEISKGVYAIYHGGFIEMVLRHFDDRIIGKASASARIVAPDDVG